MNFRLFNYLQGVSSLVNWSRPFHDAVREASELAQRRAAACGMSLDEALDRDLSERRMSQLVYTMSVLMLLTTVVFLAVLRATPEWVLCILALLPSTVLLTAIWLEHRMRRCWRS